MASKKENKSKMKSLFRGFRKSTTDLSEWNKNDEKLMKAVEAGDVLKVEGIVSKKTVNPTKLGEKGLSVFHVACRQGKQKIVECLIAHGAEVNALTIQGYTSLQLAAREGWPKVVERLIQAGGVVDHKDSVSLTALHHACACSHLECVKVLLMHGADANSRDKTGKPPLFYAAYSGEINVCKELLERGANVNAYDDQQLTPLMAAAKCGHAEVCALLLRKGADANFTDKTGHKALEYGLESKFENLVDIFKSAPTRASWDVQPNTSATPSEAGAHADGAASETSNSEMPEADQGDIVAEFVPESTPEFHRKHSDRTESTEDIAEDEVLAERAASPPQSVIEQRTLEAYKAMRRKELEEENEQMNADLRKLMTDHRKLQEAHNALKQQLNTSTEVVQSDEMKEMEEEIQQLKNQLTEEQEKNMNMLRRMKKLKAKSVGDEDSGEDSWNDSDEELFSPPGHKSTVAEHKPQTLLLLQNQVTQLRQENKQLRDKLQSNGAPVSESSPELDLLKQRVESLENEKQRLLKELENNNVFPEEERQNMMVLEQENAKLHSEVKQLRMEVSHLKVQKDLKQFSAPQVNGDDEGDDSSATTESFESAILVEKGGIPSPVNKEELKKLKSSNETLRTENALLTEELESLRDTYSKLVLAGDNLQDMYDQLVTDKEQIHEEYEKVIEEKYELGKENEDLLADANAMHEDIEKLVQEVSKLQELNQSLVTDKEDAERKLAAVNVAGKASDIARLIEERDKYQSDLEELERVSTQMKHDHDIVLEEVQSLQEAYSKVQDERDQLQQEMDSLQDECEMLQQNQDSLQQDYNQLEHDFSELLADKEKLEQEFLEVNTANVQVANPNPALEEERDNLQQENGQLAMERDQLEMTIKELSKSNALLQEEVVSLKEKLKQLSKTDSGPSPKSSPGESKSSDLSIEAAVEKDRRIRSLQIQISRLQQQLAVADRHHQDVINTYRTHLLSAVQGHMDPDVKQALYNIIELRSMEQFC